MKLCAALNLLLLVCATAHAAGEKRTLCGRAVDALSNKTTSTYCGVHGAITQRGSQLLNIWDNQPLQSSPEACGAYCQQRIGNYSESFSIQAGGSSSGYVCSCYQFGIGALKLNATAGNTTLVYYDTACFSFSNC
ncbi:hypothetical protein PVAG01_08990 [Phlyctema vagabunda]|uniref:Uncharacterized protein n=1 Tax=Phlyctema vagabunda TaxID=108571 RepID=A0ABR4PAZ8_9HELO